MKTHTWIWDLNRYLDGEISSFMYSELGLKFWSACWTIERRHSSLEDKNVLHSVTTSCTRWSRSRHFNAVLKSCGAFGDLK